MLYRNMKEIERIWKERKATTIGYLIAMLLLIVTAGVCAFVFDNAELAAIVLVAAVLITPAYIVMMIFH